MLPPPANVIESDLNSRYGRCEATPQTWQTAMDLDPPSATNPASCLDSSLMATQAVVGLFGRVAGHQSACLAVGARFVDMVCLDWYA